MKKTNELETVWGVHPVLELLRTNPKQVKRLEVLNGRQSPKVAEIVELAKKLGIGIKPVSEFRLPASADKVSHQGICAFITPYPTVSLDELFKKIEAQEAPAILVALDSIQDPHNLGAIIRSASAAGAIGVILPKDRAASLNATVAKASAGAIAHMAVCPVTNLSDTIKKLQKKGFWIFGAAGEASQSLYEADLTGPVCLVIGGEKNGIRPLVREHCDFLLSIPMAGSLDSLNASVAAGIMLFEAKRQRMMK